MSYFPKLNTEQGMNCFNRLKDHYQFDLMKILNAAEASTAGDQAQIVVNANNIVGQLQIVERAIRRTTDNYGVKLLIKIIEFLFDDLVENGINYERFLEIISFEFKDGSEIRLSGAKVWHWVWKLEVEGNVEVVSIDVRSQNTENNLMVPENIQEYIQQSVHAFNEGKHSVSMALMSIALEGTLRDALEARGIIYRRGSSGFDTYEYKKMRIAKNPDGFLVSFPEPMPISHADFQNAEEDLNTVEVEIRRVLKTNDRLFLEIKNVTDIVDFWSSNSVQTPGEVQVSGLGAAIRLARGELNILTPVDLPPDLDETIQAVRNNLIHSSNAALSNRVMDDRDGNEITLEGFLKNRNRVFDAVCAIGDTINKIYNKIADGSIMS